MIAARAETIRHIAYDTLPNGMEGAHQCLFSDGRRIGQRELTNMDLAGQASDDNVYTIQRLLAGGPTETLRDYRQCCLTLGVGGRSLFAVLLDMMPDGLGLTPMGYHYLYWNVGPFQVQRRQMFSAVLDCRGGDLPKSYVRVALDGLLIRDLL